MNAVTPSQSSARASAPGLVRHRSLGRIVPLLIALVLPATAAAAFWNLTGSVVTHDPSITKEGSTWWIFETGVGLPVKYSANGTAWNQGVKLFASDPAWWNNYVPNRQRDPKVWAPDIHRFGNRTYCYYSISIFGRNTSAIGLMSCSSIAAGDWRDDGVVISSKEGVNNYNAIDPNLTIDAGGNPWLVFGSWFDGIKIVRLGASTMKPTGSIFSLARRSGGIEGPSIVYVNGYYYLFVSIDRCCNGTSSTYKIAYGRATSITGPYLDRNGNNMLNGAGTVLDAGNAQWRGPGGQDVYQNGTGWVIARHAYNANNNGTPTLLINDLFWDSSLWPRY